MYLVNSKSGLLSYHTALAFGYDTIKILAFGFIGAWLICKLQPKAPLVYPIVAVITMACYLMLWEFGIQIPAAYWVYLVAIPLFCALLSFSPKSKVGV